MSTDARVPPSGAAAEGYRPTVTPAAVGPLPRPRRPRRPLRMPRMGRFRFGRILLVLLLVVVAFGVYVDATLTRVDALPADGPTSRGTNWLIVGSDSRNNLTDDQKAELATGDETSELTDTIMILHTGSGPTTLVSLPRDSMVQIPGHGRDKINSAYGRGGGANGGGPELLTQTVEQATGLRIDHYLEIGFLGVVSVVDAVGGVYMCVPESIKDPKAALNIKAGCQTLDKATALGYVRTRATASSDFGRVERQRAFISALLDKVTSPAVLLNPFRLVPLATGLSSSIAVDNGTHVWNLAALGFAMRGLGDGVSTTVPVRDGVVNWDKKRSAQLFEALANDEAPPKGSLGP
jgi:LCP family protein required for cell wall assembly